MHHFDAEVGLPHFEKNKNLKTNVHVAKDVLYECVKFQCKIPCTLGYTYMKSYEKN
jgi:hypothetical protein